MNKKTNRTRETGRKMEAGVKKKAAKEVVGFIGQGWIGKNYADDFERRGYAAVRYGLEAPYAGNKEKIRACGIVIIAVPTPTTPRGFSSVILEEALALVGPGATAIIKSTILPGTTARLQKKFPAITILYSPEFLSEATAAHDASHPFSTIMGMAADTSNHRAAARRALAHFPKAPFSLVCAAQEAEVIKYSHNASGYVQIILFNILYDLATKLGCDWQVIARALGNDPFIPNRYANPVHKGGRGAGGHCFIKDIAALRGLHETLLPKDALGVQFFRSLEAKNIDLLLASKKDVDLLKGVYGPNPRKVSP